MSDIRYRQLTAAGVMRFQHGHPILAEFLREMSVAFDGNDWGTNGPLLVSRVLMRICNVGNVEDLRPDKCLGVATLPTVNFYPVPWRSWRRLFEPKLTEEVLKEVEESYCVHIWGRHSKSAPFPNAGTKNAFAALAARHCPLTYREGSLKTLAEVPPKSHFKVVFPLRNLEPLQKS